MMNYIVQETLSSERKLEELLKKLKKEIADVKSERSTHTARIKQDIKNSVYGCGVHVFGSQYTGLATKDSDIDIYIDYDDDSYYGESTKPKQLANIENVARELNESCFDVLHYIPATIPILRVFHKSSEIHCDLSFKNGLGMENSILTRELLTSDFRVSWLVITIKWWMKTNNLSGTNKFTSHVTTWLVFFFLMTTQPNILAPVVEMKEGWPNSVGGWDCRINRNFYPSKHSPTCNKQKRVELLLQFFLFYGKYEFERFVICPLTATSIKRTSFENMGDYIRTSKNPENLNTSDAICLQDPQELSNNIAKRVKQDDLIKFKRYCSQSAGLCSLWVH